MTTLNRLWNANVPLTAAAVLMLVVLAASLGGLWLDPRVITGAPAWLKPVKFAASTAIYMLTMAWIFGFLGDWPRVRRIVGWTTAVIMVLEVGIIDVQAWRGTTSHFNLSTPLNAVLFGVMGLSILVQTLSSVAVAVALWRQPWTDRALGWALRLGLTITIVGACTGALMTRPTAAQLADAQTGHPMTVAGAHTVGAPDGGAGLPGTGWSVHHGDVRVPHFVGLHAMQVLPLLAWITTRRRGEIQRVRLVMVAAASYVLLYGLLLAEALRGEPVTAPSPGILAGLTFWALMTLIAVWLSGRRVADLSAGAAVMG
jgi:hypothetical protein